MTHRLDEVGALERTVPARILGGLTLGAQQRRKQHVMHESGLAGAADARDTDQGAAAESARRCL